MPTACHAARRCVSLCGNGSKLSSGQGAGAITEGLEPSQMGRYCRAYDLS